MEQGLKDIIELSREYGRDPDFVLAGGGNTSFKDERWLSVKASGATLADAGEDSFVRMDRAGLAAMWEADYPSEADAREAAVLADLLAARAPGAARRPSVETLLHELFPQRLVVHTHPTLVNGLTCAREGRPAAERLFGGRALWVEAIEPGYVLAARLRELLADFQGRHGRPPELVLIQNHGLFVAADSPGEIRRITDEVEAAVTSAAAAVPLAGEVEFDRERAAALAPAVRMLLRGESGSSVTFRAEAEALTRLGDPAAFEPFGEPFTPDHMVYCGRTPLFVPSREDLEAQYDETVRALAAFRDRHRTTPRVIGVQGLGIFFWGETRREAETVAALFRDALRVARYAESFGGAVAMPGGLIEFIAGWEVERFRRRVSLATAQAPRLAGKIALVTGAAQGFGAGLARRIAEEGGDVVVADLNAALSAERAAAIAGACGGRAISAAVDVGEERSVREMVEAAVLACGGIDLLVSNAGVLRAGGLEAVDGATFDMVTRVNYTGYFHCVRHVSRVMRIQRRFAPDHAADIVQINSKSGLAGSKMNFAYAGGKFGGIGLTQSFALELVEHGIKVNSICPGNFFDGPLWSDPQKGLFVQYLAAGKIPGAKTVQDVKRHYESLVPMGRGCTVEDVFRALLYAVEQRYETGQAIPVTGGQIMLG